MSRPGQGHNRMTVLHERVWFLISQLTELQNPRSRVEQAEERSPQTFKSHRCLGDASPIAATAAFCFLATHRGDERAVGSQPRIIRDLWPKKAPALTCSALGQRQPSAACMIGSAHLPEAALAAL